MIYSRFAINCDVSIYEDEDCIYIYQIGKDKVITHTIKETIDKCLELRDNGVHIPNYVFEKLRSEDV